MENIGAGEGGDGDALVALIVSVTSSMVTRSDDAARLAEDMHLDSLGRVQLSAAIEERLGGFVACVPSFTGHAVVMNGASDLVVEVFGEPGRHARTTIGVPSLPGDAAVEVEGLFQID